MPDQSRTRTSKARVVDGNTGEPLSGIKFRVQSLVTGEEKPVSFEVTSDAQGIVSIDVTDGAHASVQVISIEWWQVGKTQLVNSQPSEPKQPIDIKLNRGQPIDIFPERQVIR